MNKAARSLLDVRIALILLLIIVSTGHVGRLFADREDTRQEPLGYVLAVALDGVLVVALANVSSARQRGHRFYALAVFLIACGISAGFNIAYYRQNYPADPLELSVLLGTTAPVLAALVGVLREFRNTERAEDERDERASERALESERLALELAKEETKQLRAQARALKAEAVQQVVPSTSEQTNERGNGRGKGRRSAGALDDAARAILLKQPDIGPRPLARELDCSPSTASGILRRLRE